MEKLSIIIPMYNAENTITDCVESILCQDYNNLEVICIDDGSTDNTKKIVNNLINKDKRIKYFYKENGGPSSARNLGLMKSTGELIMFIDSDDKINFKSLNKYIQNMKDNDIILFNYSSNKNKIIYDNKFIDFIIINGLWTPWGKIVRKKCIVKLFNEKSYVGEDLKFWFDNCDNIKKFEFIPEKVYTYSYNKNSIMNSKKLKKEIKNFFYDLNEIIESNKINEESYKNMILHYCNFYYYFRRFDKENYLEEKKIKILYKKFFQEIMKNNKISVIKKIKTFLKYKILGE